MMNAKRNLKRAKKRLVFISVVSRFRVMFCWPPTAAERVLNLNKKVGLKLKIEIIQMNTSVCTNNFAVAKTVMGNDHTFYLLTLLSRQV